MVVAIALLDLPIMNQLPAVIAGVVAMVIVALAFVFPEKMLLAAIAAALVVPVEVAVKLGSLPRIGPTRVLLGAFFVGYFGRAIATQDVPIGRRPPLTPWIGLFVSMAMLSALLSPFPLSSVYSMLSYLFENFLIFYAVHQFLPRPGFWGKLKTLLYVVTAFFCIYAVVEELALTNPIVMFFPGETMYFRGSIMRARATFFHPIALACYLTLIFPVVLFEVLQNPIPRRRVGAFLLMMGMLLALFLTVSRSPWVAVFAEMGIFLLWWMRRNLSRIFSTISTGVFILSLAIMTIISSESLTESVGPLVNPSGFGGRATVTADETSSEYYRVALFLAVVDGLEGFRWAFGFGPGTFHVAGLRADYAEGDHTLTAADSYMLKLLFEHGLVGLGCFLLLELVMLLKLRGIVHREAPPWNLLALGAFAGVFAFAWENITVSMFVVLPLATMFWILVAVGFNTEVLSGEDEEEHYELI